MQEVISSMELLRITLLDNPGFHVEYTFEDEYWVTRNEKRNFFQPYPEGYWTPLAQVESDLCEHAIKIGLLAESEDFCSCFVLRVKS